MRARRSTPRTHPKGTQLSIGDFHNHSTCSDGKLTPTQLVDLAASRGVRIFALTDHDTYCPARSRRLPSCQCVCA